MEIICAALVLILGLSCAQGQRITQSPRFLARPAGQGVSMECSVEGASDPYMYWYRQDPSGALHLLSLSYTAGSVDENPVSGFKGHRPKGDNLTLQAEQLAANYTGLYLCAWSRTLGGADQTDGRSTQSRDQVKRRGESAQLECSQDENHNYMYWYRQDRGTGPQLLCYSLGPDMVEQEAAYPRKVEASRPQLSVFHLEMHNLQPNDSAVYLCASSHSAAEWAASCTKTLGRGRGSAQGMAHKPSTSVAPALSRCTRFFNLYTELRACKGEQCKGFTHSVTSALIPGSVTDSSCV
ncbi:uncharacterized protein LOC115078396, partial [Rhinatrema bivittatum]|uniref:uncharacterized protein LOC115078396 n=1 Tax=Rhinatrema bivittatum TaxID=194408 RepID=UPI0011279900